MKLIAQMVGRNEADRFLTDVLAHLRPIVDEIVFTDDASDDDTPAIAGSFGAHVYVNEEPLFEVHEGKLRTMAWANLSRHAEPGDWILAIDCDEKLFASKPNVSLRTLMSDVRYDVIGIRFYHMWTPTHYRVDKLWGPTSISSRMFRFFYGGKFPDRALACGSEPSYVNTLIQRQKMNRDSGLIMQHLGYVRDEDKLMKHDRYMRLDAGKFHNVNHLESIIDTAPTLVEWSFGGVINA